MTHIDALYEIDKSLIGKTIYATNPDISGYVVGEVEDYCPTCKCNHPMYETKINFGFPLHQNICPLDTVITKRGLYWLRDIMHPEDDDYPFFGIPDKVAPSKKPKIDVLDELLLMIHKKRIELMAEDIESAKRYSYIYKFD